MDTRTKLVSAAEQLFDRHGFTATGMDRLTHGAGMSTRTLYKHAGSKTALITQVLNERHQRFQHRMDETSITALFDALEEWFQQEGCRGCLFLRALGETGGDTVEIAEAVLAHKAWFHKKIEEIVRNEIGGMGNPELAEQIVVLFEGATAAAVYRGPEAVASARNAAAVLVDRARQ